MTKNYGIAPDQVKPLVAGAGGCIASDRITVDMRPVGYMYREEPDYDGDSGWRFFAGDEDDAYMTVVEHFGVYDVNFVANCDQAIIPYLPNRVGTAFERQPNSRRFMPVETPD
jgi:hypothetical protein